MNTPRTDAAERKAHGISDDFELLPNLYVPGDFARQLETELATMTALADKLAKDLRESRNVHLDTIERCPTVVREAITTYEAHKQKHHE